jgi:hypothetical protein
METTSMIVSAEEAEPEGEMVIYFTGVSPDLRVRAAALVGITAKVIATTEVASAKLRGLFMTFSPVEGAEQQPSPMSALRAGKKGYCPGNLFCEVSARG